MQKLRKEDLWSLELYDQKRQAFRAQLIEHKKNRRLSLGAHANLYFEDRLTMHYQIQEMLRAERIFSSAGIAEELETYNPLIPDGDNWKATFMLEYENVEERQLACREFIGIEDKIWVQIGEEARIYAIADEDLTRETDEKTSTVHFLRFQLNNDLKQKALNGAGIRFGSDHPNYKVQATVSGAIAEALLEDLSEDVG